jgi:hypothetical protein
VDARRYRPTRVPTELPGASTHAVAALSQVYDASVSCAAACSEMQRANPHAHSNARQAHNLKVVGSNPIPATKKNASSASALAGFFI